MLGSAVCDAGVPPGLGREARSTVLLFEKPRESSFKLDVVLTDLPWQRSKEVLITKEPKGRWDFLISIMHSIHIAKSALAFFVISCVFTLFFSYL